MSLSRLLVSYIALSLIFSSYVPVAAGAFTVEPFEVDWISRFDTESSERTSGIATDMVGNVLVVGLTDGSLDGPNVGGQDAFVSKLDTGGSILWTRQLGTTATESGRGVAADELGNVLVTGSTAGILSGQNLGDYDVFVRKYDGTGGVLWTRQFGTEGQDTGFDVVTDNGNNVIVTGATAGTLSGISAGDIDAFVRKYDTEGQLLWTRQLGTETSDFAYQIATDDLGNVYIGGRTRGALAGENAGGRDAFIAKYSENGDFIWTRQFGTGAWDAVGGLATDGGGNVYVSGFTGGSLGEESYMGGFADAFVGKYDADGDLQWIRHVGTSGDDYSHGVEVDTAGNVFVAGKTDASFAGSSSFGGWDTFLSMYDADGNSIWTKQFGTGVSDYGNGVAVDNTGAVFVNGWTGGGDDDVFVAKLVPEPSTLILLTMGAVGLLAYGWRRRRAGSR